MLRNEEAVQAMAEEGHLIGTTMRNMLVHGPRGVANTYSLVNLGVFSILMKYCSDNREILPVDMPDILDFKVLQRLFPDMVPKDQLERFLTRMQETMGLETDQDTLYGYLFRSDERKERELWIIVRSVFDELEGYDLSVEKSGATAVYAALAFIETLKQYPQMGMPVMPMTILRILEESTDVRDGARCYSCTRDGAATLAAITTKARTEMFVPQGTMGDQMLNVMLLMMVQHTSTPHLIRNNVEWLPVGLEKEMGKFDLVTALPPFGPGFSIDQIRASSEGYGDAFISWWPTMLGSKEWIYARHVVQALSDDGVGYVVYPLGALSRTGAYEDIRETFIRENLLDAVIELPSGTFPGTGTKTAILVIRRKRTSSDILMVNLGGKAASKYVETQRGSVVAFDYGAIGSIIRERSEAEGISRLMKDMDLLDNGSCLSPSAYVMERPELVAYDMDVLVKEDVALSDQLEELDQAYRTAIAGFIKMKDVWHDHRKERRE